MFHFTLYYYNFLHYFKVFSWDYKNVSVVYHSPISVSNVLLYVKCKMLVTYPSDILSYILDSSVLNIQQ